MRISPSNNPITMTAIATLVLFIICVMTPGSVLASDGDLDPTFGVQGKVIVDLGQFDSIGAIALQSDGKIVTVGSSGLARFNSDGSLDPSFANGGQVSIVGKADAVAIQVDGKILIAGSHSGDFRVARYFIDGSVDLAFGNGGIVITDFGYWESAYAMALQADGKIVVAGEQRPSQEQTIFPTGALNPKDIALSRYNSDGSLDTTFGAEGRVVTDFGGMELASAIAIQLDGKIVVAGGLIPFWKTRGVLARYNSNGSLDASFGVGGRAPDVAAARFYAVGIQPDGRIVAAGGAGPAGGGGDFALSRFNADGSVDTSFGSGGLVTTHFSGEDLINKIAILADGKIIAAGNADELTYGCDGNPDFALARYNSDGSLDMSFGNAGKLVTDFVGFQDRAEDVVIQTDGKIVVAGSMTHDYNPTRGDSALARYTSAVPGNVQVTVQTAPAGLHIEVDGTMFTAPQNFSWSPGSNHTVATTSPQDSDNGIRRVFANWDEGGAISHTVAPTVNTTYTANFTTQYLLTTTVSPAGSGTIGTSPPSADGYYDSGTSVQLSPFPNIGYAFTTWSGDVTGSDEPRGARHVRAQESHGKFQYRCGTTIRAGFQWR